MTIKKLIEVALPLEAINAAASKEKSIRNGHPASLHMWWARRPLVAARAILWATLVDDPCSHPELFNTEEKQKEERERLFEILKELVIWENSNNISVLKKAKNEILRYTNGKILKFLDPFSGGGAIPLEAQRLGLEAHAHDLNPVAVMINKAMIEIPAKFANIHPVNPQSNSLEISDYCGVTGLAEDIEFYGNLLKKLAFEKIGNLYPKVKVSNEHGNRETTVIAWLWARTVRCSNPACHCEIPLIKSYDLSRKKGKEVYSNLSYLAEKPKFSVEYGKNTKVGIVNRNGAKCPKCGSIVDFNYIRNEGINKRLGLCPIATVGEWDNGRVYISPDNEFETFLNIQRPDSQIFGPLNGKAKANVGLYGFNDFSDLFTNRQLITLNTFCELLPTIRKQIEIDIKKKINSKNAIIKNIYYDDENISYSMAICVYLSFIIDKMADLSNSLNRWEPIAQCPRQLFARQAIPMIWDFAESNIFSNSSGSWSTHLENFIRCFKSEAFNFKRSFEGTAKQFDAQNNCDLNEIIISTDPPYYDNICYSDLSDFFYVWLRKGLKDIYPNLFKTLTTPKNAELIASPFRFKDNITAKNYFEKGMLNACKQMRKCISDDYPLTIYYAYKQSEGIEAEELDTKGSSSTGWETMISAIINSGFSINGTWPIKTECSSRAVSLEANALASSIVLVCRKRQDNAPVCSRRNFLLELKKELKVALKKLQETNLAPVDLAQSAIGPGIGIFSKYSKVLEADGKPMSVRSALQIINNEIDLYFNGQDEDLDKESRFCVELYTQYGFDSLKYGDAETLSKAKNASITLLSDEGILFAEKGIVHLVDRSELKWPKEINARKTGIWLWAQLLTKELAENGINGASKLVSYISSSDSSDKAEKAKALVYRLYTIAEHKNWAKEAYAYNSLVISWPQILASSSNKIVKQQTLQF